MYVEPDTEAFSRNHCGREKAISIGYFSVCVSARAWVSMRVRACVRARVCVGSGERARGCSCANVVLLIQHARRMRHIVLSFVSSRTPPNFSILSH